MIWKYIIFCILGVIMETAAGTMKSKLLFVITGIVEYIGFCVFFHYWISSKVLFAVFAIAVLVLGIIATALSMSLVFDKDK